MKGVLKWLEYLKTPFYLVTVYGYMTGMSRYLSIRQIKKGWKNFQDYFFYYNSYHNKLAANKRKGKGIKEFKEEVLYANMGDLKL